VLTPRAAFYGLGLNNSIILTAIGWGGGANVYEIFYNSAVGNLILICAGAIPGYWVTVAFVDTVGRKPIQIMGFAMLTILFIVIGFAYNSLRKSNNGLLALYVLAQFFFNFGPNAPTFIVPGECFPTRYRSTSHGFSAAAGKVGAIIAQADVVEVEIDTSMFIWADIAEPVPYAGICLLRHITKM
jgi:PHS family inorganic phosphate transporter-like MFS transporter